MRITTSFLSGRVTGLILVLATGLAACQSGTTSGQGEETAVAAPNALTEAEKADGWQLLFNGQDLSGWHSYLRDTLAGWGVVDSTLAVTDGGVDLVTDQQFTNFDFQFEWKIPQAGNSGVMYLVVEDTAYQATYLTGPEYQLLDDIGFPQELKPSQYAAAAYDMYVPEKKMAKPAGEWNQSRLVINNGHVEHWLNGEKVVEYDLGSDSWKLRVETSKWKDAPAYGQARTGHIALQGDHGGVWFRNMKIKQL